jgi:osmotically-inducible protein OsmY
MTEFELRIGAKVYCRDGEGGNLAKIIIDPQTNHVSDLIVEQGFLFKKERVIPISTVTRATEQNIHLLSTRSDQLENYPEYKVIEIEEPDLTVRSPSAGMGYGVSAGRTPMIRRQIRRGVADGLAIIGRKTAVKNIEGQIGTVDHLLVDPTTGEVIYVVVRQGALFPTHLLVPVSLIREIYDETIFLVGSDESLMQLTRYTRRNDETTQAEVQTRLIEAPFVTKAISIKVTDGVVHLAGVVSSEAAKTTTERMVRQVEGVVDVKNGLIASQITTTLIDPMAEVVSALTGNPRTRNASIDVVNENGTVTLIGEVNNVKTREAAEAIAGQQPGVISVINTLKVKTE